MRQALGRAANNPAVARLRRSACSALGELIRQVDAKNQTVTMAYDKLGRMTSRNEPDLVSGWTYDTQPKGIGKLATATSGNGYSRTHSYDALGRLSSTSTVVDKPTPYVTGVSYDAYPNGTADPNGLLNNPDMYHGFTGHEMLDDVGLIHMNGRLYDPVMGRFVSADFMIPDAADLQYYNRYSYVGNNPLAFTDASGQCPWCIIAIIAAEIGKQTGIIDTGTARMIQGIAVSVMLGPQFSTGGAVTNAGITGNVLGSTLAAGFAGGFVSSNGSLEGGMQGMLSAGLFYGAGSLTQGIPAGDFGKVMAHAVAGCVGASASGGNCGNGAISAGFAEFAGPRLNLQSDVANLIAYSTIGGVASVLGGGKFQNGAMNGAFGYLF